MNRIIKQKYVCRTFPWWNILHHTLQTGTSVSFARESVSGKGRAMVPGFRDPDVLKGKIGKQYFILYNETESAHLL